LPQTSLLITPLITGTVGYVTNWLAIKMLFRPHRRSWYSLGWQGVIPRNRSKLASKVGFMVGEKLIGEDEISSAVKSETVQDALSATIETELESFLKKNHGSVLEILEQFGIHEETLIKKITELIEDETVKSAINEALTQAADVFMEKLGDTELSEIAPESGLETALKSVFTNGNWQGLVINEISNKLNNIILSGKSFADLLPSKVNESTGKISGFLTDKSLDILDKLLEDPASRKKIAEKLTSVKDSLFGGSGFDQLKHGLVNMFLNEDTIADLVEDQLPKLIEGLKNDPALKQKMSDAIKNYIDGFLARPLYAHAGKIGFEAIYEIRGDYISRLQNYLASDSLAASVSKGFAGIITQGGGTIGSAAEMFGIDLTSGKLSKAAADKITGSGALADILPKALVNLAGKIRIDNIYSNIPKKSFLSIKIKLKEEINILLEKNVPGMLKAVDLPGIVKKKINSLNLYEVEDILFDFMKDQFKWINRLGFLLGFLLGLAQVIFFTFFSF
jgi:uncharacterized membrane protein YheB (UPF0754 family)